MRQKSILRNRSTHLFLNGVRLVLTSCSALARTTIVEIDRALASSAARQYELSYETYASFQKNTQPFISSCVSPDFQFISFLLNFAW